MKLQEQRQRLQKKLQRHLRQAAPVQAQRWTQFMSLVSVLQEFSCLDHYQPTASGEIVAAIRGDNELWLAMSLMSNELDDLDPHHLAGVIAALVTEPPRSGTFSRFHTSETIGNILHGLKGIRRQIFRCQRKHQVFNVPVWLEPTLAGLVEQWATGLEWEVLERGTNLDSGDLVRLLRRTLDLLSQIPHIPHIPAHLKDTARQAQAMLDRFPVSEVI